MKENIPTASGMLILTPDPRSLCVYRGYISVKCHWIEVNWEMQNILLDFIRFPSPHTGDVMLNLLYEALEA